jgi:uridine phosphorylase
MTYPKYKGKHFEESLIDPEQSISEEKLPKNIPKKIIICYQKTPVRYFKRKYKSKKIKKIKLKKKAEFYQYKNIGLVYMAGIGAPHACVVFEMLIAMGCKTFINIGAAGGLHHEGIFLCEKAMRDEGTSYHYIPHGHFIHPDAKLTKKLGKAIEKQGIEYFEGTTWTIDAPYRETKAEVQRYAKKGIATVEMEASALFAVAKYRKVRIAAAFIVSDILGEVWEPRFGHKEVKEGQKHLVNAAVECLK